MNALLYLASFFLLTSAGVFGFDLPGTLLIDQHSPRTEATSGYFVSVPGSLPPQTAMSLDDINAESIDRNSYSMRQPAPAPRPAPAPQPEPLPSPEPTLTEPESITTPAPEPETAAVTSVGSSFTTNAIVAATNNERIRAGLPPLRVDSGLNTMAAAKVDDMIRYDYFDHVSPAGIDLNDLAESVSYRYILIGENLAYGNFADPQSIIDAWMDSPGHRANILHEKYTHIGVSVRKAYFRGIDAWVAVQEFSIPAAICTEPSKTTSAEISARRAQLDAYQQELTDRDRELSATPTSSSQYNTLVAQYNALVVEFRALADIHNAQVSAYNEAVQAHRTCVESLL